MKSLLGKFGLASDAVGIPSSELPDPYRTALGSTDSIVWTQTRSRLPSLQVGPDGSTLLEMFRKPIGVAEAVVRFSRKRRADPEKVMVESYPLLRDAVDRGLLVSESEWSNGLVDPLLQPGDSVGPWRIERPIQVLEEGEVHQAVARDGRQAALKVGREGHPTINRLRHEAAVLSLLGGTGTPRVLECSSVQGLVYLALEWCEGQPPAPVAESLRSSGLTGRRQLVRLALAILDAYERLHRRGVVHGDVHPRNLLVGPDGRVVILDFGHATAAGVGRPDSRAYVPFYLEPEAARPLRGGRPASLATVKGEQYGIAALLFELLSGHSYLDFSLEPGAFLNQLERGAPRTFLELGLPPWPRMERVLNRALAKRPGSRYPSVQGMADQIRRGRDEGDHPRVSSSRLERWLRTELAALEPGGSRFEFARSATPRASVHFGFAGPAVALLRIARLRDDPHLLAAADAWCAQAEYRSADPEAFSSTELELPTTMVAKASLHHGIPGIALVRASIAEARADRPERDRALQWFLRLARAPTAIHDLTLGYAGSLLGAAHLRDLPDLSRTDRTAITSLGETLARRLFRSARRAGGPDESGVWANLGMAHGWAGVLTALLSWHQDRSDPRLNDQLLRWLDQLDARGQSLGRGRRWPWLERRGRRIHSAGSMAGCCNGSAGFVQLWCLSHRIFGREEDRDRAVAAAWDVWSNEPPGFDLCCGRAGAAYALLSVARATGDDRWVARAKALVDRALRGQLSSVRPHSLWRGLTGLVLIAAELDQPARARYPLLEGLP